MKQRATALSCLVVLIALATGCGTGKETARTDWRPVFDIPLPSVVASKDPAVIAEGEYLFHAVAHCNACHQPRGAMAFASPEKTREFLPIGGQEWSMGEMGTIRSANITPDRLAGVGAWTDAQLARAIKYALNREGHSIFLMNGLGYLDDQDVLALVSYLRTLKPVEARVYRSEITPAGRKIYTERMQGNLEPRPQHPVPYAPPGAASVERGAYLANGPARCIHCHSNLVDSPHVGMDGPAFSGSLWPEADPDHPGMEMNAPNLTPSEQYGAITHWTEAVFVARFKAGRAIKNSPMPWESFRLMADADLVSLFRYLKTLDPVDRNAGPTYRPAGWKPDGGK